MSVLAATIQLAPSDFPPFALGFMGLGTGYLIYGPQELFGFPKRDAGVDYGTGVWGIWLPGFMQFVTGVFTFAGLVLFGTFAKDAPYYMAALAFTAYGVHWFAIGWNRMRQIDPRVNVGMAFGFLLISILGVIVFFKVGDNPVGGLFIGLVCVYVADFVASLGASAPKLSAIGTRVLGFFHIGTGLWLLYLMFGLTLNVAAGFNLPV